MEHRPFSFLGVATFLHQHLLWFLISAYTLAALWPTPGLWIRNLGFGDFSIFQAKLHGSVLLLLIATLMFNAGLGVRTVHFHSLLRQTRVLFAGLTANLIIPMTYIFLVTLVMRLWYEPEEAQYILVGLALVAAMPIAGASTAWVQNSNGNLALSLGLVLASTILSPVVTPVMLDVFGEMASEKYEALIHDLATYGSGVFLSFWIVLPAGLGLTVRFLAPEVQLTTVMPFIKLINSVVLLLLNYSNAAVSLPQAVADRDFDFLAVTLGLTMGLCIAAFSAGYGLSRLFMVDRADRVSLMYGLGMNNNGTALVLASLVLAAYPQVMVPIIFYNLVQHLVAGSIHEVMSRNVAEEKLGGM